MVSSQKRNENVSFSTNLKTKALNDWIKNIKSKKSFKRKQSKGQDLRTLAILTHSLIENQKILQKKRSERWMEIKKLIENGEYNEKSDSSRNSYYREETEERKNEIKALWKEELSDIDDFITSLNSIKTSLVR